MPGEELFGTDGTRHALAAILFQTAVINAIDVYSAVNSSPWTAESFGGDAQKAQRLRYYVAHGLILSSVIGGVSALVARSWWPVVGVVAGNAYMLTLYEKALSVAAASGSATWSDRGAP